MYSGYQAATSQPKQGMYSLEGLSNSLGSLGLGVAAPKAPSIVELAQTPDLDSDRFQSLWMQLPEAAPITK